MRVWSQKTVFAFGSFSFDAKERLLVLGGRSVSLPPKALALLALLIENRGQLVEKEDLMKHLWPDTFVEEGNLTQHIFTLRRVIGEDAIETMPRRGYRFIAEVKEVSSISRRWRIGVAALGTILVAAGGGLFLQARSETKQRQREAYELCFKGRSCYWDKRTPDGLQRAIGYFEKARDLDPQCAKAWAGLSICYGGALWSGMRLPYREAMQKAKVAAERALQLDPQLSDAHAALGYVKFCHEWDWTATEREYRTAIRLDPRDSDSHLKYAIFLAAFGRADEAIDQTNQAQKLDALSPFIQFVTGYVLKLLRRQDQAIEAYRKALELEPNYVRVHQFMHAAYLAKGMYDQAASETIESTSSPERAMLIRKAYQTRGIRGLWEVQKKTAVDNHNSLGAARFSARLGQADEALRWLEQAYEERHPEMPMIAAREDYDPIRTDPRFAALLARMGLPAHLPISTR